MTNVDYTRLSLAEVSTGLQDVAYAGRLLIRSLAPEARRKLAAPAAAQPASDISADVVRRFVEQHGQLVAWVNALDEEHAARVITTSPYIDVVTYSVLDACRILIAHDRRHFEQARQAMASPGFLLGLRVS